MKKTTNTFFYKSIKYYTIIAIIIIFNCYYLSNYNIIQNEEKNEFFILNNTVPILSKAVENPILSGSYKSWDESLLESPMVISNPNGYFMYYHAINEHDSFQIGLATGKTPLGPWIKYSNQPILSKGTKGNWDDYAVGIGHVSEISGKYYMWYEGMQRVNSEYWPWRIGLATAQSPEGPWIKYIGNPIIDVGPPGAWDCTSLYVASVEIVNGTYYMWYVGFRNGTDIDGQLGLATAQSPEGPWIKYAYNPIMKPALNGTWDAGQINEAAIIYKSGIFHAWYAGYPYNNIHKAYIGYANSTDGINWVKYPYNPILQTGEIGEWDENRISEPHVLIENDTIYLFFTGARYSDDYKTIDESLGVAYGNIKLFGL